MRYTIKEYDKFEVSDDLVVRSKEKISANGRLLAPTDLKQTKRKGNSRYITLGKVDKRKSYNVEKLLYCAKNGISIDTKIDIFKIRENRGEDKRPEKSEKVKNNNKYKEIVTDDMLTLSRIMNKPIRRITLQEFWDYIQNKK